MRSVAHPSARIAASTAATVSSRSNSAVSSSEYPCLSQSVRRSYVSPTVMRGCTGLLLARSLPRSVAGERNEHDTEDEKDRARDKGRDPAPRVVTHIVQDARNGCQRRNDYRNDARDFSPIPCHFDSPP